MNPHFGAFLFILFGFIFPATVGVCLYRKAKAGVSKIKNLKPQVANATTENNKNERYMPASFWAETPISKEQERMLLIPTFMRKQKKTALPVIACAYNQQEADNVESSIHGEEIPIPEEQHFGPESAVDITPDYLDEDVNEGSGVFEPEFVILNG